MKASHKRKTYFLCLEETQLDNKINYLEKNKIDIDNVKKIIKNS